MTILKGMQQPERMMRTIKEEVIWLHEFTSLAEAKEAIGSWIEKYNRALEAERIYVHSALDYLSPLEFEQKFYQNYYQEAA